MTELFFIGLLVYAAYRRSSEPTSPLTTPPAVVGPSEDEMRDQLAAAGGGGDDIEVDIGTPRYVYTAGAGREATCWDGDAEKYVDPSVCEKADERLVAQFTWDGAREGET